MTCQIVIGGDESGCTIPYAENLQGISTEIKDGLAFDFEPVISSAPKRAAVPAALRPMAVKANFFPTAGLPSVFGDNLDDTVVTSRDAGGQIVSARGFSELEPERVIRACADRQAISECLLCGR